MNQKIIKRIFYRIEYELASPLAISNGNEIHTDSDVILDASGAPFIPGTSIAGAVRNYLDGRQHTDDADALFGWTQDEKGHMSPLWIYDSFFDQPDLAKISVRDGVKINDEIDFKDLLEKETDNKIKINTKTELKTVFDEQFKKQDSVWTSHNHFLSFKEKTAVDQGKFDLEIVETGLKGTAYMQLIIRERNYIQDNTNAYTDSEAEAKWTECLRNIAISVNAGDIRFGSKKNRGMGKIKINKIRSRTFDSSNAGEWIAFHPFDSQSYKASKGIPVSALKQSFDSPFLTLKVSLDLPGGISIRQYSAASGKADFEQICCNGDPVVPGFSWNGAIRGQAAKILRLLGMSPLDIEWTLNEWIGPVFKDAKAYEKIAEIKQSNVVISESILNKSRLVTMTRNRINRFTSATTNGALYTERSAFDGKDIELEIKVRKSVSKYEALTGLLILVIKDIQNGYCAVGGQTAIGRGIFKEGAVHPGIVMIGEESSEEQGEAKYLKALAEYVRKSKGGQTC